MIALAPETIHTDRLILIPLRVEHADEMLTVLSDPGLHLFTGGTPDTARDLRARYARWVAGSSRPGESWCNWVVQLRDGACLTGYVQATVTVDEHGAAAEIAWVTGTPWQGRGIATEAARGLVAWLRTHAVDTVVAHIHPDHGASTAVAAAAGLTPTGQWHDGEIEWQLTIS
ncbi:GNAT family N-acetyltransferase [Streptomyces sp. NBC_00083]|uniref:GNAT family N-acetyltransferase n=1 Tax=Streptomyces sp. NBC_00083 TaxID=2975647 RepID=UPI002250E9D2|nr:GNAT family N-acetyltransferase [Streptomyces sp. NBC_00083]MCX5387389.1 GNAT family N-acetyltransferase [Streptomyces sp. NBC_00083]